MNRQRAWRHRPASRHGVFFFCLNAKFWTKITFRSENGRNRLVFHLCRAITLLMRLFLAVRVILVWRFSPPYSKSNQITPPANGPVRHIMQRHQPELDP